MANQANEQQQIEVLEDQALENGWDIHDGKLFSLIGSLEQESGRYREQLSYELDQAVKAIEQEMTDPDPDPEESRRRIESNQDAISQKAALLMDLAEFDNEYRAFCDDVKNRKVTSTGDKDEILDRFDALVEKYRDLAPVIEIGRYNDYREQVMQEVAAAVRDRLTLLQEQGKYRELVEYAVQISYASRLKENGLTQANTDGLNLYIQSLLVTDNERRLQGRSGEILANIARAAGEYRGEAMLNKALAIEETERKILSGEMPGTEMLLDYDENHADNPRENRELIREVAKSYVIQTHPTDGIVLGVGELLKNIGMALSPTEAVVRSAEGELVPADEMFVTTAYQAGEDYKENHPEYTAEREKLADSFEDGLAKYGFEINPRAKEGESIFSKVPEDLQELQQAESAEEAEAVRDKAVNATLWVTGYRMAVMEAAAAAQIELEKLEKMTRSSNSQEYTAMHDALAAVADLRTPEMIDKMSPKQIERAFQEIRTTGARYESTHKGLFKANSDTGKKRFRFSGEIQIFAQESIDAIRRNTKNMDEKIPLGQQLQNRIDAVNRTGAVSDMMRANAPKEQVKEVNLNNLEQKLDAGQRRKIDYKALRAKLHRLQEPQAQANRAPVQAGMGH